MKVRFFFKSALAFCAFIASITNSHANAYLDQWEDTASGLIVSEYQNGVALVANANVGSSLAGTYGIFRGNLAQNVAVNLNIFDPNGTTLSDTIQFHGTAGAFILSYNVNTVPSAPLSNATSLIETSAWQTFATWTANNGDTYTEQFRSDDAGSVPEPATLALLGFGIAGIAGIAARRRKAA